MKNIYLIPQVWASRKLVMQYKVVECKRDMRKKFCKENEENIIELNVLLNGICTCKAMYKDNSIRFNNGSAAFAFQKMIGRK